MIRVALLPVLGMGFLSVAGPPDSEPATAQGQAADVQPPAHIIVEGQIFDYVGAGVSGATVRVYVPEETGRREVASAITVEMGDFQVRHDQPIHGKLIVVISKPGYQPHEIEVESIAGEHPPYIDHQFQGNFEVKGVVRSHLGDAPVAGARVSIAAAYNEWTAETGADGRFEVGGLSPVQAQLVVEAEGYARLVRRIKVSAVESAEGGVPQVTIEVRDHPPIAPGGDVLLSLKPERVVALSVETADGQPIAQVIVEVLIEDGHDYRTAATDSQGHVTVRGLSLDATKVGVRLTHPDYVSSVTFDRELALPPEKTDSTHRLIMVKAATIRGKVSSSTGKPLSSARLSVGRSSDEMVVTEWSDFDGEYVLSGIPAGEAVVTVHLAEHAPRLFVVQADPQTPLTLDVVLVPGSPVGGTVVDPEGKPVRGAHIAAGEWKGYRTLGLQSMSDIEGRFVILDAPTDPFLVSVAAPGFKPLDNQTVRGGQTDLRFRFEEEQAGGPSGSGPKLKVGEAAPDFEATTLAGKKVKLADFKGKYLFIDFWATWCGPCVLEIPHVVELHKALGTRADFAILGVSLDFDEKALSKFITDKKIAWPQVYGEQGGATRMADAYGASAIPATFLIGPGGKLIAIDLRGQDMVEQVRRLLDQSKAPSGKKP
ncbi:MAG: redoxin domain-containing protein [bacterium]|nr:redoxin domain-containing protein [bacterium]